jgi:hypothetical protein
VLAVLIILFTLNSNIGLSKGISETTVDQPKILYSSHSAINELEETSYTLKDIHIIGLTPFCSALEDGINTPDSPSLPKITHIRIYYSSCTHRISQQFQAKYVYNEKSAWEKKPPLEGFLNKDLRPATL